jgi:DNA-binding phage protein
VAGVAALREQDPEFVNGLLNAIQHISDEAQRALADPELSREELLAALSVRSPFLSVFQDTVILTLSS